MHGVLVYVGQNGKRRDVTLGDMVFCEGVYRLRFCGTGGKNRCLLFAEHPFCRRKVTLIERKILPLHECTSPSPLF